MLIEAKPWEYFQGNVSVVDKQGLLLLLPWVATFHRFSCILFRKTTQSQEQAIGSCMIDASLFMTSGHAGTRLPQTSFESRLEQAQNGPRLEASGAAWRDPSPTPASKIDQNLHILTPHKPQNFKFNGNWHVIDILAT